MRVELPSLQFHVSERHQLEFKGKDGGKGVKGENKRIIDSRGNHDLILSMRV
jgi:hypothetical protein